MTRLIPRAALRVLLADADNARSLVDAVGESVREARAGRAVETPVMTPGLAGALKRRVQAGVSAATGAIVRASPLPTSPPPGPSAWRAATGRATRWSFAPDAGTPRRARAPSRSRL